MSEVAIKVEGLGKKFRLGRKQVYKTMRESITDLAMKPFRMFGPKTEDDQTTFWALDDVNFEIKKGEAVGIIGRNGAGKSTLLKVLSRITEPSRGQITINGRVGSLLEVGTGFHPELSGRENIFMNGAILGMRRGDIVRRFDEIVAFAEVERFLDTPVKRYSSGMYMRLAFAVAAHLEPEILVVDEVLAVGDAEFQKKCLGKMSDVAHGGRTVLFVSHNMSAIQTLCSRGILLKKGNVEADVSSAKAVALYLAEASSANQFTREITNKNQPAIVAGTIDYNVENSDDSIGVVFDVWSPEATRLSVEMRLQDGVGTPFGWACLGGLDAANMVSLQPGINRIQTELKIDRLALGSYILSLDLSIPMVRFIDKADQVLRFEVNRKPRSDSDMALTQAWSYGSYEYPVTLVNQAVIAAGDAVSVG